VPFSAPLPTTGAGGAWWGRGGGYNEDHSAYLPDHGRAAVLSFRLRPIRWRGIGRALVQALEADLVADGVQLLQVKTLGPSRPDASYDQTRRFYASMGFLPLEEIDGLWPGNPCLMMVKVLQSACTQSQLG
jgi:GNAT superfamily N-acetyltransferase